MACKHKGIHAQRHIHTFPTTPQDQHQHKTQFQSMGQTVAKSCINFIKSQKLIKSQTRDFSRKHHWKKSEFVLNYRFLPKTPTSDRKNSVTIKYVSSPYYNILILHQIRKLIGCSPRRNPNNQILSCIKFLMG